MARIEVTQEQLVGILRQQGRSASFCTLIARTVPDMNKTVVVTGVKVRNPYHGRCRKIAAVNGIINWRYENAVNNQRVREGSLPDFEAAPRQWGRRLEGEPFVQHHDKLYIELKVQRSMEHYYETHEGLRLDTAHVELHLPARRPNHRQGLEREVVLRDYAMESVVELHCYDNEYVIIGERT